MTTSTASDRDATIEDIHQTRRRIAEKFGGDLEAILEDARMRQAASGREVWRPKAKPQSTTTRSTT
jgi:hypothetical protein